MGKWITARFRSKCAGCSQGILKGVSIYWIPGTKLAYCGDCGDAKMLEDDETRMVVMMETSFEEGLLYGPINANGWSV